MDKDQNIIVYINVHSFFLKKEFYRIIKDLLLPWRGLMKKVLKDLIQPKFKIAAFPPYRQNLINLKCTHDSLLAFVMQKVAFMLEFIKIINLNPVEKSNWSLQLLYTNEIRIS